MEKDEKDLNKHSIFKAFLVEIKDRWFSSRKRILKTIGVFLIPFLYGFVCIAAFWNPLGNIGSAPIAIASLDQKQLLVEDFDAPNTNEDIALGIPVEYTTATVWSTATWSPLSDEDKADYINLGSRHSGITFVRTQNEAVMKYDHTIPTASGTINPKGNFQYVSLIDDFMDRWRTGFLSDGGLNYNSDSDKFEVTGIGFPITNIKYHNAEFNSSHPEFTNNDANNLAKWENNSWNITNNLDYAQITIPADLTYVLINYIDASITEQVDSQTYLDQLKAMPLNFYVTYEKSFLSAKLIDEMGSSLTAIVSKSLPVMAGTFYQSVVQNICAEVNTIAEEEDGAWNGGYSWQLPGDYTSELEVSTTAYKDHSYWDGASYQGVDAPSTFEFLPVTKYTIQNEEERAALIDALDDLDDGGPLKNLLEETTTTGAYLIPSIEGVTYDDDSLPWNSSSGVLAKDAANSLLNRITKVTKTLVEIPTLSSAIANIVNFIINSRLDSLMSVLGLPPEDEIFSVNVQSSDIKTLFSSDQFISSVLMQDPRYMFPDSNAPLVHYQGLLPGDTINFGRIIAVLSCGIGDSFLPLFWQFSLYSIYGEQPHTYTNGDIAGLIADLVGANAASFSRADNNITISSQELADNISNDTTNIMKITVQAYSYLDINNYVSFTTIGSSLNFYGMGLGEYFVCIGLLVGTLAQIVIYDKKKRVKKISARKWYLSKSLTMVCTSVIQSTILAVSICALGWYALGASFLLQWLFMIFAGLIFVSTIQSIWFCFRERSFGLFAIMVFLVLNVACGWGTFPAFMQFPAFNWISIFLPFTYMMHIQGAIIYGISTGTHVMFNSLYILQNIATLLIYPAVFIPLGLFMSKYRERELHYGSSKGKKIANACKHLGKIEWLKPNGKVDWKALPHEEIPEIKLKIMQLYPYEKFIERFKSKTLIKDAVDFDDN